MERLSPAVREQMSLNSRRIRYPAATVAWEQGEPIQSAILVSGLARVFISSPAGRQATVRYVHPGELMGATMMAEESFPGSVQIVSPALVQYLDIDLFRRLLHSNHQVTLALSSDLAARYIHAVRAATILIFGTTIQKVAYDLLERACREQLASGRLLVSVSQQELADSVNSTREVVSRAMASLRRKGVISTSRRLTTILDPTRLEIAAARAAE